MVGAQPAVADPAQQASLRKPADRSFAGSSRGTNHRPTPLVADHAGPAQDGWSASPRPGWLLQRLPPTAMPSPPACTSRRYRFGRCSWASAWSQARVAI